MPKSKRNKIVHLTQVKKKGKDHKEDLIKQLEENVAKFARVFIFDFDSVKSDRIMALRLKLKEYGRIFAGRNSLATVTLKTIGSRTGTDFSDLADQIVGHRGLLFTDLEQEKLVDLLDKENQTEFLKRLVGYAKIAPDTITMDVDGDTSAVASGKKQMKTKKDKKKKKKIEKRTKGALKGSKHKATDEDGASDNDDENDDGDADESVTKGKKRRVKFVKI